MTPVLRDWLFLNTKECEVEERFLNITAMQKNLKPWPWVDNDTVNPTLRNTVFHYIVTIFKKLFLVVENSVVGSTAKKRERDVISALCALVVDMTLGIPPLSCFGIVCQRTDNPYVYALPATVFLSFSHSISLSLHTENENIILFSDGSPHSGILAWGAAACFHYAIKEVTHRLLFIGAHNQPPSSCSYASIMATSAHGK